MEAESASIPCCYCYSGALCPSWSHRCSQFPQDTAICFVRKSSCLCRMGAGLGGARCCVTTQPSTPSISITTITLGERHFPHDRWRGKAIMQVAHDGAGRVVEPENRERGGERQTNLDGDKRDRRDRRVVRLFKSWRCFTLCASMPVWWSASLWLSVFPVHRKSLYNGNDPPGGNLILLKGYANVFHHDYRDGFDLNGGIKNSSVAENSVIVEDSVSFGFNLPLIFFFSFFFWRGQQLTAKMYILFSSPLPG